MDDMPQSPSLTPLKLLPLIFIGSSFAGLAMHLWHGERIPWPRILGAVMLSGTCGAICFMMLWTRIGADDTMLLAGLSIFCGIGGASTLDLATGWMRKRLHKAILPGEKGEVENDE